MSQITLIIPAKSESESLPVFLRELEHSNFKKIIILEKTDEATINSIKKDENLEILFQYTKGYGAAIREGINKVKTKYFCIINADGSMNPKYLDQMFNKLINENLDFLFASRYEFGGGSEDDSLLTKFGNFFFSAIGRIFFNLTITDILFTYVLGKTKLFKDMKIKSNDFTLCVEFPIKSSRQGYKLGSMPSFERKRIGGKKKVNEFKDGFLILIKMVKMYFNYE
jgi:glycosyltransferase involved in cell wall biosynthesis